MQLLLSEAVAPGEFSGKGRGMLETGPTKQGAKGTRASQGWGGAFSHVGMLGLKKWFKSTILLRMSHSSSLPVPLPDLHDGDTAIPETPEILLLT